MGKYEIRTDTAKNRIYVKLEGFLRDPEVLEMAEAVIAEAKRLRQGFDVINDISDLLPVSQEAMADIARIQLFLKEHGVRRVIRVISRPTLSAPQFARTSKESGYEANIVTSLEEAERLLDQRSPHS